MKKFIYHAVEGEDIRIEVEGDVKDSLVAIGELIGNLHSTYSRHDPALAGFFQVRNPTAGP